jgi:hypothetical protein
MVLVGLLLALAVGYLVWRATQAGELFCVSVRHGRLLLVRGRAPGGLLADLAEVVGRPPVERATIRAFRTPQGAQLVVSGSIDEGRAQRLRNVFGIYPMSRLRSAPVDHERTMGQVLGIAWLAWILDRSAR